MQTLSERKADPRRARLPGEALGLREVLDNGATASVIAASIAWALTVAPAGLDRTSGPPALACSILAFIAGIAGPLLARRRQNIGRHVGISAFVALSAATWLLGPHAIHPLRIDSIRGLLGACAWVVFAVSWGDRRVSRSREDDDRDAPLLLPRATLPLGAVVLSAAGFVGALVCLASAWQVRDPSRALASHAVALGCALALVGAGVTVAVSRSKRRPSTGRRLTPRVVRTLVLLVSVAVAGAVITAMR